MWNVAVNSPKDISTASWTPQNIYSRNGLSGLIVPNSTLGAHRIYQLLGNGGDTASYWQISFEARQNGYNYMGIDINAGVIVNVATGQWVSNSVNGVYGKRSFQIDADWWNFIFEITTASTPYISFYVHANSSGSSYSGDQVKGASLRNIRVCRRGL